MSDYVLLIAHTYKEKSDEKFKTKKWTDFFKENKKVSYILIIALVALIFAIISFFIKKYLDIYSYIGLIVYVVSLAISIYISDKKLKKNYKNRIYRYNMKLELLKYEFKLYEQKKIEELIKLCDLSAEFYELSTKMYKPIISLTKSIFFPIIAFSFGLIAKKIEISVYNIIQISVSVLLIILMSWLFFQSIRHHIENFLDADSKEIRMLKGMLNDLIIKDFLKDENKKSNFEIYSGSIY
ncbi:hypothetical protein [Clostridium butyricum]|uniref:hypothetical protein n=1 Tax=Clostridium butyricum TaxID=1492 RepID=UPI0018ABCA54|nr:hypothetical protein [Clostridium butyricum]